MKIIEVRPTTKFGGSWAAIEAPGVKPTYPGPDGKQKAIDYAKSRFGGAKGELHIYYETGASVQVLKIDGGTIFNPETRLLPNE